MKIESRRVDPTAARRHVTEKLDNGSAFSGFLARSLETGSRWDFAALVPESAPHPLEVSDHGGVVFAADDEPRIGLVPVPSTTIAVAAAMADWLRGGAGRYVLAEAWAMEPAVAGTYVDLDWVTVDGKVLFIGGRAGQSKREIERVLALGNSLWTANGALIENGAPPPACGEDWPAADASAAAAGAVGMFVRAWDGEAMLLVARSGSSWASLLNPEATPG